MEEVCNAAHHINSFAVVRSGRALGEGSRGGGKILKTQPTGSVIFFLYGRQKGIRQKSLCNISFALLNNRINLVLTLMIYGTFWNLDKVFLTSSSSALKKKKKKCRDKKRGKRRGGESVKSEGQRVSRVLRRDGGGCGKSGVAEVKGR